jgi:hypothetical protein
LWRETSAIFQMLARLPAAAVGDFWADPPQHPVRLDRPKTSAWSVRFFLLVQASLPASRLSSRRALRAPGDGTAIHRKAYGSVGQSGFPRSAVNWFTQTTIRAMHLRIAGSIAGGTAGTAIHRKACGCQFVPMALQGHRTVSSMIGASL